MHVQPEAAVQPRRRFADRGVRQLEPGGREGRQPDSRREFNPETLILTDMGRMDGEKAALADRLASLAAGAR